MDVEQEIEGLTTAIRVVTDKLNELVSARDAAILKETSVFKQRKTRAMAGFFGGYGYRILDFKAKEDQTPEYKTAKLIWNIGDTATSFLRKLIPLQVGETSTMQIDTLDASSKTDFLNLCKAFKSFSWIDYSHTWKELTYTRLESKGAVPFWKGGWAELVNRYMVLKTLGAFAKKYNCSYDVFLNVRLARIAKKENIPDMELDIVVQLNDWFYIFETKSGFHLCIDKWVDRARMFNVEKKARFITCCSDNSIPVESFKPFKLFPLSSLEVRLRSMLANDQRNK